MIARKPAPPPPPGYFKQVALLVANLRRAVALAWRVEPGLVARYVGASVVDALLPVAIAYVGKLIVDHAVAALGAPAPRPLFPTLTWVAVELALVMAKQCAGQLMGYTSALLRARLAMHVSATIFEKAQRLSVRHFEDPDFMDALERARKDSSWRPVEMITHGLSLGRNVVTLAGYAALLLPFSGWAVVALGLAALPFLAETRYAGEQYKIKSRRTQDERQSGYFQQLLSSDYYVKEVKLFGLAPMLMGRYQALHQKFFDEDRGFAAKRAVAVTALGAASAAVFYGVYAWIVARTIAGTITLGSMALYLTVFRNGQGAFQSAMTSVARAYEDNLYINNLFEFLAIPDDDVVAVPLGEAAPRARPGLEGARAPELRFRAVGFAYPGSERPALEGVDLTIAPGETVALVGPNGAGKTTLVKLLTGLYAPTSGTITIDGEDVATMDRGALRARIGVVFQDFVHYHFTASDNVGMGWLPAMGDRASVERAAREAGAAEVLESLPAGYDTMLGRWFGGEQLSIGQWQRVALARAFMRRSEILVLDEPTAAIDAEGEHAIFERFKELTAGRTAILITHRFSTVRMADRIVVVDGGRVVETGTHAELMARRGLYARMFSLQARGYTEAGAAA